MDKTFQTKYKKLSGPRNQQVSSSDVYECEVTYSDGTTHINRYVDKDELDLYLKLQSLVKSKKLSKSDASDLIDLIETYRDAGYRQGCIDENYEG